MQQVTKLRVESAVPVPVHVDGEIYRGDTSRLDIEVIPKALTVIGNFPLTDQGTGKNIN
jgi:diacylglycerol kinase family enzyme